jgi:hypothetical protein
VFLSPGIGQLQSKDSTLHELVIETNDPRGYFKTFLSLGTGMRVTISSPQFLSINLS